MADMFTFRSQWLPMGLEGVDTKKKYPEGVDTKKKYPEGVDTQKKYPEGVDTSSGGIIPLAAFGPSRGSPGEPFGRPGRPQGMPLP